MMRLVTFDDGDDTEASRSLQLIPGILNVSLHWLPTSVTGTASLMRLIFSSSFLDPRPLTGTAKGDPGTWWSANFRFTMYSPGSVGR